MDDPQPEDVEVFSNENSETAPTAKIHPSNDAAVTNEYKLEQEKNSMPTIGPPKLKTESQMSIQARIKASSKRVTLDEIRQNLKQGSSQTSPIVKQMSIVSEEGFDDENIDNQENIASLYSKFPGLSMSNCSFESRENSEDQRASRQSIALGNLLKMMQEILVMTDILQRSCSRIQDQKKTESETLRQLERFLDSPPPSEFGSNQNAMNSNSAVFADKFESFKTKAKQHLRECTEDRNNREAAHTTVLAKLKGLENDHSELQELVMRQRKELEEIRELQKTYRDPNDCRVQESRITKLQKQREDIKQELDRICEEHKLEVSRGKVECKNVAMMKKQIEEVRSLLHEEEKVYAANRNELQMTYNKYRVYAEELVRHVDAEIAAEILAASGVHLQFDEHTNDQDDFYSESSEDVHSKTQEV